MSATISPTIPALPNAIETAQSLLASMAAQTGILTDYNSGSIIRQIAESLGAVMEEQGVSSTALVYQAIVYGAYAAYGIQPLSATAATGQITFWTSLNANPPAATQTVVIPAGTFVQTAGGVQFQTLNTAYLVSGATNVSTSIISISSGSIGNVPASSITQILNGLSYPLYVTNPVATLGGSNMESPNQTAARFAAAVALPGLASPLAVANAAIGVAVSGTGEICLYSTCYEPWIAGGSAAGNLGFQVYIDNGTGSASLSLIAAVTAAINSSPQYRPAGVPWSVQPVVPSYVSLGVTGQLLAQYESQLINISGAVVSGIYAYFSSLQFGQPAYQSQIAAAVANAVPSTLEALTVSLSLSGSLLSSPSIAPSNVGRIILSSLNVVLS